MDGGWLKRRWDECIGDEWEGKGGERERGERRTVNEEIGERNYRERGGLRVRIGVNRGGKGVNRRVRGRVKDKAMEAG